MELDGADGSYGNCASRSASNAAQNGVLRESACGERHVRGRAVSVSHDGYRLEKAREDGVRLKTEADTAAGQVHTFGVLCASCTHAEHAPLSKERMYSTSDDKAT